MTPPRFSLRFLRAQCTALEEAVQSQRLVSDEALAASRPGTKGNPSHGVWGWVRFYGSLSAFLERAQQDGVSGTEDAEAVAVAAMARVPVKVEGLLRDEAGEPVIWHVHPKGYLALEYFHAKDLLLAWLNMWSHRLLAASTDNAMELLERVALERGYQNALLCWCATTPGPWLPFEPTMDSRPPLPELMHRLDPLDILRIQQANARVNASRGAAISRIIAPPKDDAPKSHGWSVFYASMGQKLQVPVGTLMRDYTLVELLVQSGLAGGAEREAYEAAKAKGSDGAPDDDEDGD